MVVMGGAQDKVDGNRVRGSTHPRACPYCGGRLKVTHTKDECDRVVRWRKCDKCGGTFRTREMMM